MRGFARRRGIFVAQVDRTERIILSRVVADTALLLGTRLDVDQQRPDDEDVLADLDWSVDEIAEPTDPALARLLPNASEDDAVADEFRRLTEQGLRAAKVERLRMVWGALLAPGERLEVQPERAMDWAAALTDVRLVLAERLGIVTDDDAEAVYAAATSRRRGRDEDEVRSALASLYMALTWLQESLLAVMVKAL